MTKVASSERSVVGDAVRTAVGGILFCCLLYLLDLQFSILKVLSIDLIDLQMIGVCVILFAIFWPLLAHVFFEPYLKLVAERERVTVGAEGYLKEQELHAQELDERYEARLSEVRGLAMREKMSAISDAKEEAAKLIERAQNDAQQIIKNARSQISERQSQLAERFSSEAEQLAKSMVSRILEPAGSVKPVLIALFAVLGLLIAPHIASAAVEHHAAGEHVGSVADLKYFFINFILYVLLIVLLVKKFAPAAWGARRARIIAQLTASREKIENVEKRVIEARGRLAKVEEDAVAVTKAMQAETLREVQHIKSTAQRAAERIVEQARSSARAEEKAADKVIRRRLVEKALELAENNIKGSMSAESDRQLRQRAQSKLGELREQSL